MAERKLESEKLKSTGYYYRLMKDAKNSGSIGRIFNTIESINRSSAERHLIPSNFRILETLYTSPVYASENLIGELTWGSIVLKQNQHLIEKYIEFKNNIENLIFQSKWEESLVSIADFELHNGAVFILKELSIAITQQMEGTAKQVAFSRKLEAQSNKSVLALFIRFASERNEDRLTLSGFRRNFREYSASASSKAFASAVIYWHGLHQLPKQESLLAQLLGFENSGSIFDYYEIYVAASISIATRSNSKNRTGLKHCLQRISGIKDQRLLNLTELLSGRNFSMGAPLTADNVFQEIKTRSKNPSQENPLNIEIAKFLKETSPSSGVRRNIHKLSANFFHLDLFQAVFSHLEHKTTSDCFDQAVAPGLFALASGVSLRSVFACSLDVAQKVIDEQLLSSNLRAPEQLASQIAGGSDADTLLFSAIILAKNGELDKLLHLAIFSKLGSIDRSHLYLIAIKSLHEAGRYIDLLPLALEVSEIRLDALTLVPIVSALEKVYPSRLASREAVLFSIVASRVLLVDDSDRLEDKLMVAAEVAFSDRKISPNWAHDDGVSLQLWIVFLRDVMVMQNMLLIDEINSLNDALNLRVEVLRKLIEIDPDSRDKYQEEVRDITFGLSVDEGVRQVNTSRLNVNITGLTKWANDNCLDDYERYKELVIGEGFSGQLPIKFSGGSGSFFDQFAMIPLGVADDQLVKLFIKIRNAYLSDPRNGLDAYISLRVRHGSLSGTLSRGLDTRQLLLLQKSENGPFERPTYWINRLDLSVPQTTDVTRAFAIFTAIFRKSIDDLLHNRLHVKNERNPQGEITIEITEILVKGLKIDIMSGMSFDTFISTLLIVYRNNVSSYLESLRKYLKTDFLNNTVEALEKLAAEVGRLINNPEKQSYLDDAITNARLDLQGSIRIVCDWLEIAQKEDLAQLYTLKQATEIGINYTRQVRNNFSPTLSVNGVDENFRITGASLIVIVDILFILLDNVYKHAGIPNKRSVTLNFDLSEENLIKINVKNDLAATMDRSTVIQRLEAAKKLLSNDEGERKLTEEDRSGLPKLSRLVVQDRADALTFGLIDDCVEVNVLIGYASLD